MVFNAARNWPIACVLVLLVAPFTTPAADNDPPGPVTIELADKTLLSGVLVDSNDESIVLRTHDGERKIERKSVKSVRPGSPVPASAKIPDVPGDDMRIGKAGDNAVVDDTPDDPTKKGAQKPQEKKAGAEANDKLLDALKNGGKAIAGNQPVPDKPANPAVNHDAKGHSTPEKDWEQGFVQIDAGNYKAAATAFRSALSTGNNDEINKAEQRARQKFNRTLPEVVVMCYATFKCQQCKGDGVLQCEDCNGTGYLLKNITAPNNANNGGNGLKTALTGNTSRPRIALCQKCHGNGFDVCMQCLGTGIGYIEPTSYEKEQYSGYFTRIAIETLGASETSYGDTPREQMPPVLGSGGDRTEVNLDGTIKQVWLRDSADRAKSDIIRLWRAEGFYRLSLKADPSLMIRSTKDLNQELIKIKIRRQNLYGELSERLRFKDNKTEE